MEAENIVLYKFLTKFQKDQVALPEIFFYSHPCVDFDEIVTRIDPIDPKSDIAGASVS